MHKAAIRQAAEDFNCSESALNVTALRDRQFAVTGCGKAIYYDMVGDCVFSGDSIRRDHCRADRRGPWVAVESEPLSP